MLTIKLLGILETENQTYFAVFVHLFHRFIFAISSQVTKASSEQKVCNTTTLHNPIESLKRNTRLTANCLPHFGGPHRFTLMPLKTKYNTPFVLGDGRGSGVSLGLPRWTRGVSAQGPHAPQTSTQTRDWHHEGKSQKFFFVFLGGGGEKKKPTSLFLVLEL